MTTILDLSPKGSFQLARLVASRMLIQANSGGGKSWALRYLLEQTHGRIQHLVLDSEGEFSTLREKFDYVLAGRGGDVPADPKSAKLLCRRLVEIGASAVIDLYDLKLPDRRRFVKLFLDELMHLPRGLWHPILVVIDEAHRFCPERGSGEAESTEAVITLCTQGRKRGYAAVLATQRLSKLHKDAAAELLNTLIGRTGLDVDAKRAGDILGMGKEARNSLRDLEPGEFFAFGPATSRAVIRVRTGPVKTTHPEPGKIGSAPPPAPAAVRAVLEQLRDLPGEAEEEERTVGGLMKRNRELVAELRRAQKESPAPDPELVQRQVERAVRTEVAAVQREAAAGERALRRRVDQLERSITRGRGVAEKLVEALTIEPSANGGPKAKPAPLKRHSESSRASDSPRFVKKTRGESSIPVEIERGDLSGPQEKILAALARLEAVGVDEPKRPVAAALAGYAFSGSFRTYLSKLHQSGLILYPSGDTVALSDAGREIAAVADLPAGLEELHDSWRSIMPGDPQRRILDALIEAWPEAIDRQELAESLGYAFSGSFRTYLSNVKTRGAAEYPDASSVRASELVFPPGLSS